MRNSKRQASNSEVCPDRLSELPNSIILLILSLLETKYAVRTTLLSKRWKDLWTTVPCLHFRNPEFDTYAFRNFVSAALQHWKGAKILNFTLRFELDWSFPSAILDSWLLFAIDKQVEELSINLYQSVIGYCAPQRLCFCSSIRKLSLRCCDLDLQIMENVQWNRLESLSFFCIDPLSEHVVSKILRGAPRLEFLNLELRASGDDLNIQSDSLKMLKIFRRQLINAIPEADKAILRIEAPNLETLEISVIPYTRCLLKVPSLTRAILGFYDCSHRAYKDPDRVALVNEMLIQVLPIIRHVEKLTLSDWCCKVLLEMKNDVLLQFPNAKFVKLCLCDRSADQVLGVLEMFPELMGLTLEYKDSRCFVVYLSAKPNMVDTEPNTILPIPSMLHLRKVEITWFLHAMGKIFPAIKVMLENVRLLEKMELKPIPFWGNQEFLYLVEEKLQSVPRSSPTAEVIINTTDFD